MPTAAIPSRTHRFPSSRLRSRVRGRGLYHLIACLFPLLPLLSLACSTDSDRIDEISLLHAQQRYEETLEPLRAIIVANPDDTEAHYLYGVANLMTKNPSGALWSLRRASQDAEFAERADLALASAALATQNAQEAIEASSRILEKTPDSFTALLVRAEAYEVARSYEQELADAKLLSILDPSSSVGLVLEIKALLGLERVEEAEERFVELEERRIAGDLRESASRMCAARADFSKQAGNLPAAEERFEECVDKYPTDRWVLQGSVEFLDGIGKHERGTEIMVGAMESVPDNFLIRKGHVERLQMMGNGEEAERVLLEGTEMSEPFPLQSWLMLAHQYFQEERLVDCIAAWEKALVIYPNPPSQALFAYADALVVAGKFELAIEVAEKLDDVHADLVRGRARLGQGRPREALKYLESGIARWPNNAVARYYAALAAEQLGDFDRAISEYRDSLRADAAATDAGLRLGRLHWSEGELPKAAEALRHHIDAAPGDVDALVLNARIAAGRDRLEDVQRTLRAIGRMPGEAPRMLSVAAEIHGRRSGPAGAVSLIEMNPKLDLSLRENAPTLRVFVENLVRVGREEEAMQRVQAALAARPESAALHALHGRVLDAGSGLSSSQASEAAYRRALELDSGNAAALVALAEAASRSDDREAAIDLYERAALADPTDPTSGRRAAGLLASSERLGEAELRLEQHLLEYPYDGAAAALLATVEIEGEGDGSRILALVERAARFQADPTVFERFTDAGLAGGRDAEIVQALREAIKRNPDSASLHFQLGRTFEHRKNTRQALMAFRKALETEVFPERARAEKAVARLNSGQS